MDDQRFGAALRAARVRRRWRQIDVAAVAEVSASTVSRLERGHLGGLQLRSIGAIAATLEVTVEVVPRSRAAVLERVVNQAHASMAEQVVAWIASRDGWIVRPEVSFSRYGERGIIDLLGWHRATGSLLVIELKTDIVDIGELLGTLDRKMRNGRAVAHDLGWVARTVSCLLIVGESDANRRRVAAHGATFKASFPERIPGIRRWLAQPDGVVRGLVFFANRHPRQANDQLTTIRRVRRPPPGARAVRGSAGERGSPSSHEDSASRHRDSEPLTGGGLFRGLRSAKCPGLKVRGFLRLRMVCARR